MASVVSKSSGNGRYKKTVLSNGLRVVTEQIPSVRSIALGVMIDVGSRNESADVNGVSHLIEHMLFKGTKKRNTKQIASSLESIGGNLNAFTSKEQTCFTARILDEHLDIAVDVLSDMTCHSLLTPINLIREKNVVYEEIVESIESPSDLIHDIFASAYWGEHPLGRSILGTQDIITHMPRRKIIEYIDTNYRTESIVIAAAGSVSHNKLVKLAKENFTFKTGSAPQSKPAARENFKKAIVIKNNNNQIHISLGFPGIEYGAKEKMTALALNTYLGGGMSSVLFQKVREEKGMAYTIYTYLDLYRDAGVFGAYLATDKKNVNHALEITFRELQKVKKSRLSSLTMDQIKAQLKGHLTIGMESTPSRMNRLARAEIMQGRYLTLRQTLNDIDKITQKDFTELANRIFDFSQITVAGLGPADEKKLSKLTA